MAVVRTGRWRLLSYPATAAAGGVITAFAMSQAGAGFGFAGIDPSGAAFSVFASIGGAVAVAFIIATVWLSSRLRAERRWSQTLLARFENDLTVEKTFLLSDGQIMPGSPAADAYLKSAPVATPSESGRKRLQALLGRETFAVLAPKLRLLAEEGVGFDVRAVDADGAAIRLLGEAMGARAVLRIRPRSSADDHAPVSAPAPSAAATAQAQAQSTMRERDALGRIFSDVFGEAPIGIVAFDPEFRLIAANDEAAGLWRLDAEQLRPGATLRAIIDDLRVKGRIIERPDFAEWRTQALRDPVGVLSVTDLWSLADGVSLQIVVRSTSDGGFVVFISDETDALGLERRMAMLQGARKATIEAIDMGLAVFGADLRLQISNPAFTSLWGLDPSMIAVPADGAGLPLQAIAAAATRTAQERDIWSRVAGAMIGPPGSRRSESFTAPRGDDLMVAISVTPLPDGALLIGCADVSAEHRTEAALLERNAALEMADRLKTEFLAAVGIELRTPLNSVIGFAEMLRDQTAGALTPVQRDYVESIITPAHELRSLIADALDLGALQVGAIDLRREAVDLCRLLATLSEMLSQRASAAGARILSEPPETAVFVMGDAQRLKQAAFGAACTALGAAEPGDSLVLLLVSDGVEAVLRITLIRRGARVSGRMRPQRAGGGGASIGDPAAGAALSFTRQIIERHRGLVEVEEVGGEQWSVAIRLPAAALNESAA